DKMLICSANQGDSLDRAIINENRQTNDFIILNDHVEAPEELPKKTKLFFLMLLITGMLNSMRKFSFYDPFIKCVFLDALVTTLEAHLQVPRTYIGCMKSGEVFSDVGHKWYESDWWKFGDGKSYFRYASGEMYVISRGLAKFISINRSLIRTYAMMMSVSDLGLLASMLNMCMNQSFAAHLGHQGPYVPAF
ncbi:Hydroxyproline O-galactosyltransferase HPGT1, partial [Vitis vinifera]